MFLGFVFCFLLPKCLNHTLKLCELIGCICYCVLLSVCPMMQFRHCCFFCFFYYNICLSSDVRSAALKCISPPPPKEKKSPIIINSVHEQVVITKLWLQ